MLSTRRPTLLYKDTGSTILKHDEDVDAEPIEIQGRDLYRGSIDPRYMKYDLDVQWLYNDESERVGLIEYETKNREEFSVLWYYDNPYATFFQEPEWIATTKTLWSYLTEEAYQDCLEDDFQNLVNMSLTGDVLIIAPYMLDKKLDYIYVCEECGKHTLSLPRSCIAVKRLPFPIFSSYLCLDESGVVYDLPVKSRIWSTLNLQPLASSDLPVQEPVQENHPDQEHQHLVESPQIPEEAVHPLPAL